MDNSVVLPLLSKNFYCKICNLYFDSADSLDVHLQYHKENYYNNWNSQNDVDKNKGSKLKNETPALELADSSDNMITKSSSEFPQRATPESLAHFPHPATPQSYHSAPSPYQNPDQSNFSITTQLHNNYPISNFSQNQPSEQINWEQLHYGQEFHNYKINRFHPYSMQDRLSRVSSTSPLYGQPLNPPTPSPSPNQCDKCGFVCDSVVQLNEHCSTAHAVGTITLSSTTLTFLQFPGKQFNNSGQEENVKVKDEHDESSDILDLDSQKVVYQGNEKDNPNTSFDDSSCHSRSGPVIPWDSEKLYGNMQLNGSNLFKEHKDISEQKSFPIESKPFESGQKPSYTPDKFIGGQQEQKSFIHMEQKLYQGIQIPHFSEYVGPGASSNPDFKASYRSYDSPVSSQITHPQTTNATSSTLPTLGGKGANWKSNEARRPKTYNCTACNKWFTSSGHLKRHYNTTLHKNAVRSSGQPDPATMPISSHHHPSRDAIHRNQQQSADSNTQSPAASEDTRSVDDTSSLHLSYATHNVSSLQSKSPYTQIQEGNLNSHFNSNNSLTNHAAQHQIGIQSLNIGNEPPGIGGPNDNYQGPKALSILSGSNPPNVEAGPSVSQNHHMRGLLSVSTSNISTPGLTQSIPAITTHTLPPFSQLSVNPYNPRSASRDQGSSAQDPTHTPLYLEQNFHQTLAPSYPNAIPPHVMDMAINNLPTASPATFGNCKLEETEALEHPLSSSESERLPCFAQLQTQNVSVYVSNYITQPNVGGQVFANEVTTGLIIDSVHSPLQLANGKRCIKYELTEPYNENAESNAEHSKLYSYASEDGGIKTLKRENEFQDNYSEFQMMEIEDIMDYANKENYVSQMKLPDSPESAKAECVSRNVLSSSSSTASVSSTAPVTSSPLTERNRLKKTPSTLHKCYECDKLFNKGCYLTQHNKTFHSGAKPFKCNRCGKRFSDDISYEGHYYKHTDNKPFKCSECPKSFNHKTDLRRHMCLHSGCKPFSCEHCGKGFIRKDHMVKHFDTHFKKNARSAAAAFSPGSSTPAASPPPSPSVHFT